MQQQQILHQAQQQLLQAQQEQQQAQLQQQQQQKQHNIPRYLKKIFHNDYKNNVVDGKG